jgi:endonuclease YncB( thermonuclease family)
VAKTATVALIALLLSAGGADPVNVRPLVGRDFQAHVVSIVDGDTVDVTVEGVGKFRIRLDGIDTPERGEPFYARAANFTRVLVFDKNVRAQGRDVDRYGRLVARLVASDGSDLSAAIVQAGLACHYKEYSSDAILAASETSARQGGMGFWATNAQKPRCTLRNVANTSPTRPIATSSARVSGASDANYHGNTRSHVYHSPSCPNRSCPNCTRSFASEEEAKTAGYRPAGDCLKR